MVVFFAVVCGRCFVLLLVCNVCNNAQAVSDKQQYGRGLWIGCSIMPNLSLVQPSPTAANIQIMANRWL